jgi:Ca2+-binding RTX toxin-like protein
MSTQSQCESLEFRRLFAISSVSISNGKLAVTGSSGNDEIAVEWTVTSTTRTIKIFDGNSVYATYNHVVTGPNLFNQIALSGEGGSDILRSARTSGNTTTSPYAVTLFGGEGSDSLFGSDAGETIYGGPNGDLAYGYGGNDLILGEGGSDTLEGGAGNDTLYGGNEGDSITGGSGSDWLYGEAGYDTISSSDGIGGNDIIFIGADGALVSGDPGDLLS